MNTKERQEWLAKKRDEPIKDKQEHLGGMIRELLCLFINDPEALSIETETFNMTTTIEISAGVNDTARIIGPGGNHFNRLRDLVQLAAERFGFCVQMMPVKDAPAGEVKAYSGFQRRKDWPKERVIKCLKQWTEAIFEVKGISVREETKRFGLLLWLDLKGKTKHQRDIFPALIALNQLFGVIGKAQGQILVIDSE